jgi:hypothetical protein
MSGIAVASGSRSGWTASGYPAHTCSAPLSAATGSAWRLTPTAATPWRISRATASTGGRAAERGPQPLERGSLIQALPLHQCPYRLLDATGNKDESSRLHGPVPPRSARCRPRTSLWSQTLTAPRSRSGLSTGPLMSWATRIALRSVGRERPPSWNRLSRQPEARARPVGPSCHPLPVEHQEHRSCLAGSSWLLRVQMQSPA